MIKVMKSITAGLALAALFLLAPLKNVPQSTSYCYSHPSDNRPSVLLSAPEIMQ
jgi:hypothetical protein